jgi:hypothetical protein
LLLLKLLLVPGLVALVTLAVRRWGPAVGGWLAGLPIVAGPVLVLYALEQGDAFAARAAHATLAGLIATVAFAVAYGEVSRRMSWYLCMVVGWVVFLAVIVALYFARPGLVTSLLVLIAATVIGRRILRRVPAFAASRLRRGGLLEPGLRDEYVVRVPSPGRSAMADRPASAGSSGPRRRPDRSGEGGDPPGDLIVRLAATAALVLVLTGLADRLGSTWSGLLNAFPVLTTIVAVFSHAQRGAAAAVAFLNGYLQAIVGFGLFCAVMATALESRGVGWALAGALAVQLAWHGILVARTAHSPPTPGS